MTADMTPLDPSLIRSWHAHVYFDAASRDAAWALREVIRSALAERVELGRFHDKPVGPHPMGSYQLAFAPSAFATPVVAGGTVTRWFVFAFGLIWTSVFATGFYVLAVNAAEDRT